MPNTYPLPYFILVELLRRREPTTAEQLHQANPCLNEFNLSKIETSLSRMAQRGYVARIETGWVAASVLSKT
jgi:hypothetical protein